MTAVARVRAAAPAPPVAEPPELAIGGLVPLSSTDYPGCLAAVVFCQGCPWRCRYCHNGHLQPRQGGALNWLSVQDFLRRRSGLLDAVVFSGGEPTLQSGLPDAVRAAKALGFRVGLHTAGIYPRMLARLMPELDWVGLDVKAPFVAYERVTGIPGSGVRASESLDLLLRSGVPHEVRTTLHPDLLSERELEQLARHLAARGVRHYAVQAFRATGCCDAELCAAPARLPSWLPERFAPLFPRFELRGG